MGIKTIWCTKESEVKSEAIEAIRKFFENYGKDVIAISSSAWTEQQWDDNYWVLTATSGSASVECSYSANGWYKQEPGAWMDDREGPHAASGPHFVVRIAVEEDAGRKQAQVTFLQGLPKDNVLVALKDSNFEETDENLGDENLLEVDEAIKELTS